MDVEQRFHERRDWSRQTIAAIQLEPEPAEFGRQDLGQHGEKTTVGRRLSVEIVQCLVRIAESQDLQIVGQSSGRQVLNESNVRHPRVLQLVQDQD